MTPEQIALLTEEERKWADVPRCPKCKQPTASIYYMAVFGHKGKCNNVDCGYTGNWRDFFPAPAGGASLDDILKLAATADRFSPAAMIDTLEQIAMICTEGPAPAGGERPTPLNPVCPQCHGDLEKVTYPSGSCLNRDQWESVRAGDYLCRKCPDNGRANKPQGAYWWEREVVAAPEPPQEEE